MLNNIVEKILNRFGEIKQVRTIYDRTYQDLADYVMINRGNFVRVSPQNRPESFKVYHPAPIEAAGRLASALYGGLTNPGSKWFAVKTQEVGRTDVKKAQYFDNISDHLLNIFNSTSSGFTSQNYEFLLSLVIMGTAALYVDRNSDDEIRFANIHLSQLYIEEDSFGDVTTVFRLFKLTVRQIVERFGYENMTEKMQKRYTKDPDSKIEVLHCVYPIRNEIEVNSRLKNFKYVSYYIDTESRIQLSEGGFYRMPYIVARFAKFTGEAYGRSPAWDSIMIIKMLNAVAKDMVRATQLQTMPPLLAMEDVGLANLHIKPEGRLDGMLNFDGTPKIKPLEVGADLPLAQKMFDQYIEHIREAFYVDQLYFKYEGTPITATEAVQRQEARLQMLSPVINRIITEYLNNLIKYVYDLEIREGELQGLPKNIIGDIDNKEKKINIEYLSPLANMQRMADVQAISRAWASVGPVAQVDPSVFDAFKFAETGTYIGLATGYPSSLLRTQEEIQQLKAQRQQQLAQQQQQAQLQQYAQQLGKPLQ